MDGRKHGEGRLRIEKQEGEKYEESYHGIFVGDERSGEGVYQYKDGTKYEGAWKANKRNGIGTLFDEEGNAVHEGVWQDDTYMGRVSK